jgi:hypothetical protein
VDEFLLRFAPEVDEDATFIKLQAFIRKNHKQDVMGYLGKFDTLLAQAHILNEKQKFQYFLAGLPAQYKQALIFHGTDTYEAAKTKVRNIYQGLARSSFLGGDHGSSRDLNAMDIDRTHINAVKASPTDMCYYCGKNGHWAKRNSSIRRDKDQVKDQARMGLHSKEAVAEAAEEEEEEAIPEEGANHKETEEVSDGSEPSHQVKKIPFMKRCLIKTKMNQD